MESPAEDGDVIFAGVCGPGSPKRKGELVVLRPGNRRAGAEGTSPAAVPSAELQPGSPMDLGLVLALTGCPQGGGLKAG